MAQLTRVGLEKDSVPPWELARQSAKFADMNAIAEHLREFEGLTVRNYGTTEVGLGDLSATCPRLSITSIPDTPELVPQLSTRRKLAMLAIGALAVLGAVFWSGWALVSGALAIASLALKQPPPPGVPLSPLDAMWDKFRAEPKLNQVRALVLGPWNGESEEGIERTLDHLIRAAGQLTGLRAIHLGDITAAECEIFWIQLGDLTPLLEAYPKLEVLIVRGTGGLRFEHLAHTHLRKLVIQTGGLKASTINDLATARLPALTDLELWLGEASRGFDASVRDLRQIWRPGHFTSLKALALRHSVIADDVAEALLPDSAALRGLQRLDLSDGMLSDRGAVALFNNPAVRCLDTLDVRQHRLSEAWVDQLKSMPVTVDVSTRLNPRSTDLNIELASGE